MRIMETMRNIFLGILFFVFSTNFLFAQEFVDATDWFSQTGSHVGYCYFAVNSKTGEVAYDAFLNGTTYKPTNLLLISNLSTLPYSNYQGMRYFATTIGNISFFNENVVYYPFEFEGTWFHIVDKPVYVATVMPNSTSYKIYSIPAITVNPSAFIPLFGSSGGTDPGTDPPGTDPPEVDIDLEGVITLLSAIHGQLGYGVERLNLLTEQLSGILMALSVSSLQRNDELELLNSLHMEEQSLVCLLSFVGGMVLFAVFMSGLRLH